MSQMLLFADARPLVERLGQSFFRQAPQCPGVYLMRDAGAAFNDWNFHGPIGAFAFALHGSLVRLLWCALYPERGISRIPPGWFHGGRKLLINIPCRGLGAAGFKETGDRLREFFAG